MASLVVQTEKSTGDVKFRFYNPKKHKWSWTQSQANATIHGDHDASSVRRVLSRKFGEAYAYDTQTVS